MKSVLKGIPHLHSKVVSKYEEGGVVKPGKPYIRGNTAQEKRDTVLDQTTPAVKDLAARAGKNDPEFDKKYKAVKGMLDAYDEIEDK